LDDLDEAYKQSLERGGKPIEGYDEFIKKEYSKLDNKNDKKEFADKE
jgi:hypothetical protein